MFDSGGSSGVLRDELGVLPPGDILKCALALARNEAEARRVLLSRLPTLEHARLAGHTGGNLLLSMMERYSGDFLAAVDGLRALLGCHGRVWPASVEQASVCAEYADGSQTRGEVEVDAGQSEGRPISRLWLDPPPQDPPAARRRHRRVRRGHHRAGQLLHQPDAAAARRRDGRGAAPGSAGPVILVANLLTEGRGMSEFTAADAVRWIGRRIGRPGGRRRRQHRAARRPRRWRATRPSTSTRCRSANVPSCCEVVEGEFWHGEIARHARRRLSYAVWSVVSRRLLQ